MRGARVWFLEHPPSAWIRFLETAVKFLNCVLLVLGLIVSAWSIVTVVQIQQNPPKPQPAPTPPSAVQSSIRASTAWQYEASSVHIPSIFKDVPWFIFVFGALGIATTLTAAMAIIGTRLRSAGCLSSHIFFMCLLLTGQACAAVAFFVDAGWEKRLPDIDEQLKQFLLKRLQVCKWLGFSLFVLQLVTLLLSCALQSTYVLAEEAAEDAEEEASWARRPLLQQQQRHQPQQLPTPGAVPAAAGGPGDDGWSARMQQQYGLDTSQFTYRPGADAEGLQQQRQDGGRSRTCVVM